ncbi:leucine-rich repeat receptor protein kinase [Spatholobus suberectus]|nr:leucine-rich repeat receptor protein kinase [Spatholobus suberectus]
MQLFVSNFYGATFLVIYGMVIMGIVLEVGAVPAPSELQLEANAIINSGWWNGSHSDSHDICSWYGIHCNKAGSITGITIRYMKGIQFATLNLSALKNLESLEVPMSGLEGAIPPEIGNLSQLTYLDLSYNSLSGEIPSFLGNLIHLESLIISHNNIQGSIPSELFLFLKNLTVLDLSYNRINGTLPISLSNLTKLHNLDISNNLLVGSLKPFSSF